MARKYEGAPLEVVYDSEEVPTVAAQQCGQSGAIDAFRNALELPRWYSDDELLSAIRAYLEAATPPDVAGLLDAALRELDNVTAVTDQDSNCIGCAENLLRQAATALRLSAGGCKTERRKFYHHGYSTAELLKARKSPPEFFTDDGEAWRYEYTHSDGEGGAYDMLYRPASTTVEAGHVE